MSVERRASERESAASPSLRAPRSSLFALTILVACAAALAFGLLQLFQLRFEAGDVYPAYSSLRADPLGTMALYESLQKMPGVSVRRDFSASDSLPEEPNTVYLHLAGRPYELEWVSKDLYAEIQGFLGRGGRLVMTMFPQTAPGWAEDEASDKDTNTVKSAKSKDGKSAPEKSPRKMRKERGKVFGVSLTKIWNIHTDFRKLEQEGGAYQPASVFREGDLPLPPDLEWHSGLVFTNLDKAWKVIYSRGTNAVVVERQFGKGSVVMATDSYFASNEALAGERHADLLAWLVGAPRNVVFDEAHLGIVETSGVAMLMRKYRLHGLIGGLVLLAGLFIWKNATSLVPPREAAAEDHSVVAGKESAAGFVNLLRRSIAPRDLLATCFAEWKKSVAQEGRVARSRAQEAEAIYSAEAALPPKDRNAIAAYRRISGALGKQNPITKT
jgi:hypothetical protein